MSYCKKDGKDVIIFATKENHETPSTIKLPEPEKPVGVLRPDGSINWGCPCLGGMATGPCGIEFREAFSCFQNSQADPKGSDCLASFNAMQECMHKYPTVYGPSSRGVDPTKMDDDEEEDSDQIEHKQSSNKVESVSTSSKSS